MSLTDARNRLVAALREGRFEHEPRDVLSEKNLLAVGDVDVDHVVRLLQRTRGDQYEETPHHWDAEVTVHVFTPIFDGEQWYIKVYFLESAAGSATFISVHR